MKTIATFLLFAALSAATGPNPQPSAQQQVRQVVSYMQSLNWLMRKEVDFTNSTNLTYKIKNRESDGPVRWGFVSGDLQYSVFYSGTDYINQPSIKPFLSIWVAKVGAPDTLQTISLRDSGLSGRLSAVTAWGGTDLCKASAEGCAAYQGMFDQALRSATAFIAEHPIKR